MKKLLGRVLLAGIIMLPGASRWTLDPGLKKNGPIITMAPISFHDDFSNSTLDTRFRSITINGGTINETDKLTISTRKPMGVAYVYFNRSLAPRGANEWEISVKFRVGSTSGYTGFGLLQARGTPGDNPTSIIKTEVNGKNGNIRFIKNRIKDRVLRDFWDRSKHGWVTAPTTVPGFINTIYTLHISSKNGGFIMQLRDATDRKIIAETQANWEDGFREEGNLYFFAGDISTGNQHITVEIFDFEFNAANMYETGKEAESPWIAIIDSRIDSINIITHAESIGCPSSNLIANKPNKLDKANKVLTLGNFGTWEDTRLLYPSICESKDGNKVYLFYTGGDGEKYQIGVASVSKADFNGTTFTKSLNNPIIKVGSSGSWKEKNVSTPYAMFDSDDDVYKMWFNGVSATGVTAIGYATCQGNLDPTKGTNWKEYSGNPIITPAGSGWESTKFWRFSIIKIAPDDYRILYTAGNDVTTDSQIGYATSTDGIRWIKYAGNPVLKPRTNTSYFDSLTVFSPSNIFKNGNYYEIIYQGKYPGPNGYSTSGFAKSRNFIEWEYRRGPILITTKAWEGYESENPFIYKFSQNQWWVYYDNWFASDRVLGCTRFIPPHIKYQYALNHGSYNNIWLSDIELNKALSGKEITDHTKSLRIKAQFNTNGNETVSLFLDSHISVSSTYPYSQELPRSIITALSLSESTIPVQLLP